MIDNCVITTSHNATQKTVEYCKRISEELGIPYYNRRHLSKKVETGEIEFYYVIDNSLNLSAIFKGQKLSFHPGIAKIRMENYKNGFKDYLIESIKPEPTDIIYDGTFGLGQDALFLAYFSSKVIGTEASKAIYTVVSHGLKHYVPKDPWVKTAMERIEIHNVNMKEYLEKTPEKYFDIVYCDPMFENPIYESSSLNPLRGFANYESITLEDVENMIRVAKKRVVIKSHVKDTLFDRLKIKFTRVLVSKKNGLIFGCIDLD